MKLAFIGIGNVGFAIADRLAGAGHEVIIAHDNPASGSVRDALGRNASMRRLPVAEAVTAADAVFLSTPFRAVDAVLAGVRFGGRPLIDCTNPVGPGLTHRSPDAASGAEHVQALASDARVVKAFSIYGYENFADSTFPHPDTLPAMFIAGDDDDAKSVVSALAADMGFAAKDTGPLSQSLHLEHLALLWIKMVRLHGHQPHLVWACLEK